MVPEADQFPSFKEFDNFRSQNTRARQLTRAHIKDLLREGSVEIKKNKNFPKMTIFLVPCLQVSNQKSISTMGEDKPVESKPVKMKYSHYSNEEKEKIIQEEAYDFFDNFLACDSVSEVIKYLHTWYNTCKDLNKEVFFKKIKMGIFQTEFAKVLISKDHIRKILGKTTNQP